MYEALVKRLRAQADAERYFVGEDMLYDKAADAIEELQERVKTLTRELDEANQDADYANEAATALYGALPRWIPVQERLPEESEGLNWHEDVMIRFTSVWCCDANTGLIAVRNRLQGKKTGNKYLDQYTKDTAWHWSAASWEPTHWLPIVPLPTPPKENGKSET